MLEPIVGEHSALRNIRARLPALATSCDPLVIAGESGVGKSLIAAHIHARGPFACSPLVTIDCSLLEHRDQRLLLFGAEPPETTSNRRGMLERPATIVLKEPGALYLHLQEKLARALTDGSVRRFGAQSSRPLAARIICCFTRHHYSANPPSLAPALQTVIGGMRRISLPPLRMRRTDIPLLMKHFIRHNAPSGRSKTPDISPEMRRAILAYPWPGNIGELKAFIRGLLPPDPASLLAEVEVTLVRQIYDLLETSKPFSLDASLLHMKRMFMTRALRRAGNTLALAARLVGMTEPAFRRELRRHLPLKK